MKKFLAISATLAISGLAMQAYAAAGYYVEIGEQAPVDATKAKWEELSAAHKSLLGKLNFYPKTLIGSDGNSTAIIQAGPIDDKNKAQRLCNKLFAKDVPCFVIEGLEKAPPTVSIGMSRALFSAAAAPAPSAAVETVKPEEKQPEVKKEGVIGQISAPAAASAGEAKVAVAEAIPVPLTSDKTEMKAEVKPVEAAPVKAPAMVTPIITDKKPEAAAVAAPVTITNTLKVPAPIITNELAPVEFTDGAAGWLTISGFENKKSADAFWHSVRDAAPEAAAGLRVRVLRPLLSRNNPNGTRVNVGPFPSNAAALNFCAQVVAVVNPQLTCGFERGADTPVRRGVESVPVKIEQGDRYQERRRRIEGQRQNKTSRRAPASESESLTHNESEGRKSYWAQVVIADSKAEAKRRLEDITNANVDVLSGISSRITSNPTRKSRFTVRLGPLTGESAANELCDTLQARGLDCLVLSTK